MHKKSLNILSGLVAAGVLIGSSGVPVAQADIVHGHLISGEIERTYLDLGDQDAVDLYSKSLYIEFDTLLSQRDFEHVADILTANPDATILSFKGGIDDLNPAIVDDILLVLNQEGSLNFG